MPSRDEPPDAEQILRKLAQFGVEYVLIGGLAVQTHGHARTTQDADIVPAPEPANLHRLADALRALGARVLNPGSEGQEIDATMLPQATIWQFSTVHGGLDVIHEVPGGASFAELKRRALHVQIDNLDIPVVGLDDLIRMKLAGGRPIDLADVAALTDDEDRE